MCLLIGGLSTGKAHVATAMAVELAARRPENNGVLLRVTPDDLAS